MSKITQVQADFGAGEISPRMFGRFNTDIYKRGVATMENAIPVFTGGFFNRPGTIRIGAPKTGSTTTRLHPLIITPSVVYLLEFGNLFIRFWKNNALVAGLEITTTYAAADLSALQFAQDATKLFISHESYPPKVLEYTAADTFSFGSLAITGNSGAVPFQSSGNYPRAVTIHAGCLCFAGSQNDPQKIWTSRPFEYGDFTTYDTITSTSRQLRDPGYAFVGTISNGSITVSGIAAADIAHILVGDHITGTGIPSGATVATKATAAIGLSIAATADGAGVTLTDKWADASVPEYELVTTTRDIITEENAIKKTIASEQGERILWLASGRDLIVGTTAANWVIPTENLSPISFKIERQNAVGSAAIQPLMVNNAVIFIGASANSAREYFYLDTTKSYAAPRLDVMADHILSASGTSVTQMDYMNDPFPIVWFVLADGTLAGCVYDRDYQMQAWFRIVLAGSGLVKSIAVIPGTYQDVLYLVVLRGSTYSIERMGLIYGTEGHLDSATTSTKTAGKITGITWITGAATVVYAGVSYAVTIAAGEATLPTAIPDGSAVLVGLIPTMKVKFLPHHTAEGEGPQFREHTVTGMTARVLACYPFKVGYEAESNYETAVMETAPFTGDVEIPIRGYWDKTGQVTIMQDAPFDVTVLAVETEYDIGG